MNELIPALVGALCQEKIFDQWIERLAFSSDAGFYRLVPKVIVRPTCEKDIQEILRIAQIFNEPVTFRAGGTSLSGQTISDGILVDISRGWKKVIPDASKYRVSFQPGVRGSMVNAILKKNNQQIGPDPSSIHVAMMGGILSNNSSGMCCGVEHNAYHTLASIRFILPNGNVFDTSVASDYQRFEIEENAVFEKLKTIKLQLTENQSLHKLIRSKYKIKNTVGYSVNAFLDFDHPLDIFAHLLIGSEGTLAFISEAQLRTLHVKPFSSTAFVIFPDPQTACGIIPALTKAGASAVELMDGASLQCVADQKGVPPILKQVNSSATALLIEFKADSEIELQQLVNVGYEILKSVPTLESPVFSADATVQQNYWKVRKGMFPSVGAIRKNGTTVVLEDIAFPVEVLTQAMTDLQLLFGKYGYEEAIIFGHAKDGNLHFVITQDLSKPEELKKYDTFLKDVVELTVKKYNGSLKAEHGTGRNMAPFVETEWGPEIFSMMKEIKQTVDPQGILNPGVIINKDPEAHLKDIKPLPEVHPLVDKCIECGYCEPSCPSKDLTLSPRQRIQVRRELAKMPASSTSKNQLEKEFVYHGLETCAVDGLCAQDCPVGINTGDLVKVLRKENHSPLAKSIAFQLAKNFKTVETVMVFLIRIVSGIEKLLGDRRLHRLSKKVHETLPFVPVWPHGLRSGTISKPKPPTTEPVAVIFQTCISRLMGGNENGKNQTSSLLAVCERLQVPVNVLFETGNCCGQSFSSKGFEASAVLKAKELLPKLWTASKSGSIPIVVDTSSCTHTMHHWNQWFTGEELKQFNQLKIIDIVDFQHDILLPKLPPYKKKGEIVLHPVCSLSKLDNKKKWNAVAEALATEAITPLYAGCCGMAGDRGMFYPELTTSASAKEVENLPRSADGYYSSSRPCELSLTQTSGVGYESLIYRFEEILGE